MRAVVLHEFGGPEKLKFEDNVSEPQITYCRRSNSIKRGKGTGTHQGLLTKKSPVEDFCPANTVLITPLTLSMWYLMLRILLP